MSNFKTVLDVRSSRDAARTIKELRAKTTRFTQDEKKMAKDIQRMIETDYLKPMLRELRKIPNKRQYPEDYPIKFKSDKQRRFVMSKLVGKPYRRKGILKSGWRFRTRTDGSKVKIKVFNKSPVSKYAVGLVGYGKSPRSIKRYLQPIQPFHTKTGWRPAYEIVQEYVDKANKEATTRLENWYAELFS